MRRHTSFCLFMRKERGSSQREHVHRAKVVTAKTKDTPVLSEGETGGQKIEKSKKVKK